MNLAVDITSWIWLALEVGLRGDRADRDARPPLRGVPGQTKRLVPGLW
jgi:hypothetical protein